MDSKTYFIETYGCQMNFADSEIVNSIMLEQGHKAAPSPEEADVIFVNTCSIRDNAERRVWSRLKYFRSLRTKKKQDKIVGVLGCMAERIREKFLDEHKLVDLVVGPDAYRDIPNLLSQVDDGRKAVNVILSLEETYADIAPVRTTGNGVTAFVSIMRGCDNMCSFCVVPFTRGRERSRPMTSILKEIEQLSENGYKEITLLGQNVNSYKFEDADFTHLMDEASGRHPEIRFRFSSPHPKDFPEPLLYLIAERPNLCNYIHMPAQSGSTEVLKRMRRPYTREEYLDLTVRMREIIPGLTISTDLIAGFCGETEEQHEDTLSLIRTVNYDLAYMYAYSERERTLAQRKYEDDVPEEVKKRRLSEIIDLQMGNQERTNLLEKGRIHLVLVEGTSKRDENQINGRTDTNKMVVFDRADFEIGDYAAVEITGSTSATLRGRGLHKTTIAAFQEKYGSTVPAMQNA